MGFWESAVSMNRLSEAVTSGVAKLGDKISDALSINQSTLSGAIDILVVAQEDGSLKCSGFHVRFGKFQLIKPHEKVVQIEVNGMPAMLTMRLSSSGAAYFVEAEADEAALALEEGLLDLDQLSTVSAPTKRPVSATSEPTTTSRSASRAESQIASQMGSPSPTTPLLGTGAPYALQLGQLEPGMLSPLLRGQAATLPAAADARLGSGEGRLGEGRLGEGRLGEGRLGGLTLGGCSSLLGSFSPFGSPTRTAAAAPPVRARATTPLPPLPPPPPPLHLRIFALDDQRVQLELSVHPPPPPTIGPPTIGAPRAAPPAAAALIALAASPPHPRAAPSLEPPLPAPTCAPVDDSKVNAPSGWALAERTDCRGSARGASAAERRFSPTPDPLSILAEAAAAEEADAEDVDDDELADRWRPSAAGSGWRAGVPLAPSALRPSPSPPPRGALSMSASLNALSGCASAGSGGGSPGGSRGDLANLANLANLGSTGGNTSVGHITSIGGRSISATSIGATSMGGASCSAGGGASLSDGLEDLLLREERIEASRRHRDDGGWGGAGLGGAGGGARGGA